jgi:lipoate-protein ligase A
MQSGPDTLLPSLWHWWEDGAHDGVTNMATDEALLAAVRNGEGTWRWYSWSAPTVSFGRNERIRGRIAPARLAASGLGVVRRPTGGRALLHWRELTYSVTLPLAAAHSWRTAYDAINAVLLTGLQAAGVPVALSTARAVVTPDGPVCFDQPAAGELTLDGRKLVGSAVWRHGAAYLQHGSILLHDDQRLLQPLSDDVGEVPPAATLASCFPHLDDAALAERVRLGVLAALQQRARIRPRHVDADDDWPARLAVWHRHFADPGWLWRR